MVCSECGASFYSTFPSDPNAHVWEEESRTEPTITAPGSVVYVCSQCGESKTESIPALPYDPSDSEHVPCTECGELADIINILKPATCKDTGIVKFSCDHCGASTYSKYGPVPSNHTWEETEHISSTCAVKGTITYTCSGCGEVKTEELPLSSEHSWQETGRTEPTTTAEGTITYECSDCGLTKSESIPKLEECAHEWTETARIEPTETTPGQITYTCEKCGQVKTENIPVKPVYDESFINWLGWVVRLFNMTLNSIIGFSPLQLYVGVLVFLVMFHLLAKLIQQGRRGKL